VREPLAPTQLAVSPQEPAAPLPALATLARLMLGPAAANAELPGTTDMVASVLTLAQGGRRKVLLPLGSSTGEFALVRRGACVLLTYYDAGTAPQVFVRDRAIPLASLLPACGAAAREASRMAPEGIVRQAAERLATRAESARVARDSSPAPVTLERQGGITAPPSDSPLGFGFNLSIPAGEEISHESGSRADLHALLFDGELWGYIGGRRLLLNRGPVLPVIERILSAVRAVVDGWERNQAVHLRLRAGDCAISVRFESSGELSVTLGGPGRQALGLPPSQVPPVILPMLRLVSDFVRAVVSADRAQSRNLRLSSLRDEVRSLRRLIRARSERRSFTNGDAELLRARAQAEGDTARPITIAPEPESKLRFSLRWHVEIDGLDAAATFMCGDRLVVATPRNVFALDRNDGAVLWIRETQGAASMMAGTRLLGIGADGIVSISDVGDGEPYAHARIAPRIGAPPAGTFVGGGALPPLAVLAEGRDRLVAIDVRTGEPRWRFRSRGRGNFRLTRAGRILLVVTGDGTLDALDVATGEVLWRWSDPSRIVMPATVVRDMAIAVSGTPGSDSCTWMAFDLYSGKVAWRHKAEGGPALPAMATESVAITCQRKAARAELQGLDPLTGECLWNAADPGLAAGGAALSVDGRLIINTPVGSAHGIDTQTGESAWKVRMADALRDDVPRRLEPVLRGGALFIPSASVHVLRPSDGTAIGGQITEDLVPDFLRVDERGWLYIAEESGHIEAHAPVPNLRLVKG